MSKIRNLGCGGYCDDVKVGNRYTALILNGIFQIEYEGPLYIIKADFSKKPVKKVQWREKLNLNLLQKIQI